MYILLVLSKPNGWGIRRGGGDVLVLTSLDVLQKAVA